MKRRFERLVTLAVASLFISSVLSKALIDQIRFNDARASGGTQYSEVEVVAEMPNVTWTSESIEWSLRRQDGTSVHFRLTSPRPHVWRLQSAGGNGRFENCGAAQLLKEEFREPVDESSLPLAISATSSSSFCIAPNQRGSYVELRTTPFTLSFFSSDEQAKVHITGISIDESAITVSGLLRPDERTFGLGERFNGANQRGKAVRIWAEDRWLQTEGNSYVPIPFFLSTEGYGVFVNRHESSFFDLGKARKDAWSVTIEDAPLDLYVFTHDHPKDVLSALAELTGFSPMPPEWAFGIFVSRHGGLREFATVEGVKEMVRKMDEHRLPWSAVILEGWPTYDSSRYGELKTLVEELHAIGKKVILYDSCGRLNQGPFHPRLEFFVKDETGSTLIKEAPFYNPADAPNRRSSPFLDITNPGAVEWWQNTVWRRLLVDIGVDGVKIDFCEQFPEDEGLQLFSGRSAKGMHHYYPVKYCAMMYNLFQKMRPEGGICWARGGGIGAQRYPFIWCGDQLREFRFLRAILSATLSSGLSGIPFMCHDLAGYMPARDPVSNDEAKVFIRGTQMACFSANMQTHGKVTRPYDFPPEVVDVYRFYSDVHYVLVPYLVEQARVSCETGVPLVRHLYLEFPRDRRTWEIEDQYFLGNGLLVAPVLYDADKRNVYLPAGRWEGLWDGQTFEGPCELTAYPAPLEQIPVFVFDGSESAVLPELVKEIRIRYQAWKKR